MKVKLLFVGLLITLVCITISCETEVERKQRLAKFEKERIESEKRQKEEEQVRHIQKAKEDSIRAIEEAAEVRLRAIQEVEERKEREIHNKYINNSLHTGATPYAYCFGGNKSCSNYGCSQIEVKTPYNSDVLVTIKKNGKVYRHAYIKSSSRYTFEFPNGTYQPFFYYGKGWYPDKFMKETHCGTLKGGFLANEHIGKDDPQYLNNNILEYELILQQNGNFSTRPSSKEEAF